MFKDWWEIETHIIASTNCYYYSISFVFPIMRMCIKKKERERSLEINLYMFIFRPQD